MVQTGLGERALRTLRSETYQGGHIMAISSINEIMQRRWQARRQLRIQQNNRSILERMGLNESILDDLDTTETGSSSHDLASEQKIQYRRWMMITVDGRVIPGQRLPFYKAAEEIPFARLCD